MTTHAEKFVGIDVAVWGSDQVWQVGNDPAGREQLLERLVEQKPELVVLEATAGYEQSAAQELLMNGFPVAVANPTRVRALAKASGKLAKTDVIDARLIAEFAAKMQPTQMHLAGGLSAVAVLPGQAHR